MSLNLPEVYTLSLGKTLLNFPRIINFANIKYLGLDYELDNQIRLSYYKELMSDSKISFKTDSSFVDIEEKMEQRCIEFPISKKNSLRGAELSKKVNQFRTNNKFYESNEILCPKSKNNFHLFALEDSGVGNYGIISLVHIKEIDSSTIIIPLWVMSCRVFSRNLELEILYMLANKYKKSNLIFKCERTGKNNYIREFDFRKSLPNGILIKDTEDLDDNSRIIKISLDKMRELNPSFGFKRKLN